MAYARISTMYNKVQVTYQMEQESNQNKNSRTSSDPQTQSEQIFVDAQLGKYFHKFVSLSSTKPARSGFSRSVAIANRDKCYNCEEIGHHA